MFVFVVVQLVARNWFIGRAKSLCCVCGISCCERGEFRRCGLSEQRKKQLRCRFELARLVFARSFFLRRLESLLNLTAENRQSRHWRRGARVFSSASGVVVARACMASRLLFCYSAFCVARRCARGSTLCAWLSVVSAAGCYVRAALCVRLGAVCARRCVCGSCCVRLALYSVFFLYHTARHGCISLACN